MSRKLYECEECGAKKPHYQMYEYEVYDTPWDKLPRKIYVCKNMPKRFARSFNYNWHESCEELLTDSSWADFRYFDCSSCHRMICERNPRNGWMSQYRIVNDYKQICIQCYEQELYTNGLEISRDELEAGKICGMFLIDSELEEHGFSKVSDEFVRGTEQARGIASKILEMMESKKVLVNYESLAIGGLEGYVSIWSAEKS